VRKADNLPSSRAFVTKSGNLKFLEPSGSVQACNGTDLPLPLQQKAGGRGSTVVKATNRKVAGSIPAGVIGFFIYIKSFPSHYGPGVDSASNRNEYQEYFLVVKAAGT